MIKKVINKNNCIVLVELKEKRFKQIVNFLPCCIALFIFLGYPSYKFIATTLEEKTILLKIKKIK